MNEAVTSPLDIAKKAVTIVLTLAQDPKGGWERVKSEYATPQDVFLFFLAPLLIFSAVCTFVKMSIIGYSVPMVGHMRIGIIEGLSSGFFQMLAQVIGLGVGAFVCDALAPKFGGQSSYLNTIRWIAFGSGLGLLASVFAIIPFLGVIVSIAAGLYGLYILFQGATPMTGVPVDRRLLYVIVCIVVMFALNFVLFSVFGTIAHFA